MPPSRRKLLALSLKNPVTAKIHRLSVSRSEISMIFEDELFVVSPKMITYPRACSSSAQCVGETEWQLAQGLREQKPIWVKARDRKFIPNGTVGRIVDSGQGLQRDPRRKLTF